MNPELDALAALGLPERIALGARAALGPDAASQVAADPWALLAVDGVRPEQVDGYARGRLGVGARPEDPRRQVALLTWLVRRAALDGHTVVPMPIVAPALAAYGIEKADTAVIEATDRGVIVEVGGGAALATYAHAERRIAEAVKSLDAPGVASVDWVERALDNGISVLAGPPGEPLDHAIGGLVARARERGIAVSLLAPTAGSAALLRAAHDVPATVDPASVAGSPGLLVVADAHAYDIVWMAALPPPSSARPVALVGDRRALPPFAGPGQPFADIAASGAVAMHDVEPERGESEPVATIAELAAAIAHGTLPRIEAPDKQVVLVPAGGAHEALRRVRQLITDAIPRTFGIAPSEVMVLGPAMRGEAGVDALNAAIKAAVNAGSGALGDFDVGDRVLLAKEIHEAAVRPGDGGLIVGQNGDGSVQVDVAGQVVRVPPPLIDGLLPAWALTVARAAVGRWPACVLVLPGESAGLLSRALLRTAITCAERHLSIVHAAGPAVAHAVVQATPRRRRTALPTLLGMPAT